MSMGEVTREEMLRTIDLLWAQETVPWKDVKAIIALIEQGKPKVGREFMDEWCGEDEECCRFIETILLQAGHEVEK